MPKKLKPLYLPAFILSLVVMASTTTWQSSIRKKKAEKKAQKKEIKLGWKKNLVQLADGEARHPDGVEEAHDEHEEHPGAAGHGGPQA